MARLRTFRNRIGNHHRIWSFDITGRYVDLLAVARHIDADLGVWIVGR